MKTLAVASVLLVAACGSRDTATGDEEDLRAKAASSASYELYFSNPLPDVLARLAASHTTSTSTPSADALARWGQLQNTQVANGGDFATALTSLMKTATGAGCALLVADYDFDVPAVAQEMANAKGRGCDVRFVTDGTIVGRATPGPKFQQDYAQPFQILKDAGIAVHNDGARGAIMHNKFTVIKGSHGNAVWTGSWNYTKDDQVSYWNNGIAIHSDDAVGLYTTYFESLYERLHEDGTVGPRKKLPITDAQRTFNVGGVPFTVHFPSTDKAVAALVPVVTGAKKSIHMLAFSFTNDDLTNAFIDRIHAGITVKAVFENTGACSGGFKDLVNLPAADKGKVSLLRWRYGPKNFLHHKVMVIDEQKVIFGSFNFSSGAENDNDENVLVVDNADFAKNFIDTYNLIEEVTSLSPQEEGCGN